MLLKQFETFAHQQEHDAQLEERRPEDYASLNDIINVLDQKLDHVVHQVDVDAGEGCEHEQVEHGSQHRGKVVCVVAQLF